MDPIENVLTHFGTNTIPKKSNVDTIVSVIFDQKSTPNLIKGTLSHFGTKGMKWGVIRSRAERAAFRVKLGSTEDAAKAKILKTRAQKGGLHTLTNSELQALNQRLELEGKYTKWAKNNPTLKQRAGQFIVGELVKEGKKSLADIGSGSDVAKIVRVVNSDRKNTPKHRK